MQFHRALTALLGLGLALPAMAWECRLASIRGPEFPRLVQLSPHVATAEGSISVECDGSGPGTPAPGQPAQTGRVPVQLRLALSPGASGNYVARQALGGPRYNLYLDAGYQRVWGDGSGGSEALVQSVELTLDGGIQSLQRFDFPIFAVVQAQIDDAAAGMLFSDNVLVTLSYQ